MRSLAPLLLLPLGIAALIQVAGASEPQTPVTPVVVLAKKPLEHSDAILKAKDLESIQELAAKYGYSVWPSEGSAFVYEQDLFGLHTTEQSIQLIDLWIRASQEGHDYLETGKGNAEADKVIADVVGKCIGSEQGELAKKPGFKLLSHRRTSRITRTMPICRSRKTRNPQARNPTNPAVSRQCLSKR